MKRSAAWSSSSVVTPGRTLRDSRSSTFVWMAPAAAMASISAGDFLMITTLQCRAARPPRRRLQPLFEPQRRERLADVGVDLLRVPRPVEPVQQAGLVVAAHHRLRLVVVDVEARADRLGLVVVALVERLAINVADALRLRRVAVDVVDVAVLAHAAAG